MKIIFLSLFSIISILTYGQVKIPDFIICSPVLFETEGNQGSGVFLSDSNNVFFVTARHNLYSEDFNFLYKTAKFIFYPHDIVSEEPAVIHFNLINAYNTDLIKYDVNHDVAVINIGNILIGDSLLLVQYNENVIKNKSTYVNIIYLTETQSYSEIIIGADIYMFGYPSSIGLKRQPQFDYYRPLLRQGIVAGKYDKNKSIIIDSPSYFGNSGGPVFALEEKTPFNKYFLLIGIVTEYIPYIDTWVNKNTLIENIQTTNSGYSIITSIEYALNLMNLFSKKMN